MKASSDLRGPDKDTHDIMRAYLHADSAIDGYTAELIQHLLPAQSKILEETSKRAAGVYEDLDVYCTRKGVLLGKITLWKLQTGLHRDCKDYLCVLYCSGDFEGGELLIPDLKLRFKYAPGDIIIFDSAALWHAVAPWQPLTTPCKDGITPGRVARVKAPHGCTRGLTRTHTYRLNTLKVLYPHPYGY